MKDIDEKVERASQRMMDMIVSGMQKGIMGIAEIEGDGHAADISEATYIATVGVSAALQIAATVMGRCDKCGNHEKHSPIDHINPTAILFCALLAAEAAGAGHLGVERRDHPEKEGVRQVGMAFEFGPDVILNAMSAVEKLTGQKPDKFLVKHMVDAVREIERDNSGNLDKFLQERLEARRNNDQSKH